MERKKPIIILTGPTGVGKTQLSIQLAKEIGGEIISADSMQVYRHMNIGSAKIKESQMEGIPHHLIDILEPNVAFNVVMFKQLALKAMEEIYEKNHIPILVGGTGFYIQSVLYDIDFTDNGENVQIRQQLYDIVRTHGDIYLHNLLQEVDPEAAEVIHYKNTKKVIRALEYFKLTGEKISHHNKVQRQHESPYEAFYFVLTDKRERLYENINQRVDDMLKEGLVEEVVALKQMGCEKELVSMQGLGYKEILQYLEGTITLEDAVMLIKRDTRHFAKRQLTWFRREKDVIWVDKQQVGNDTTALLSFLLSKLAFII